MRSECSAQAHTPLFFSRIPLLESWHYIIIEGDILSAECNGGKLTFDLVQRRVLHLYSLARAQLTLRAHTGIYTRPFDLFNNHTYIHTHAPRDFLNRRGTALRDQQNPQHQMKFHWYMDIILYVVVVSLDDKCPHLNLHYLWALQMNIVHCGGCDWKIRLTVYRALYERCAEVYERKNWGGLSLVVHLCARIFDSACGVPHSLEQWAKRITDLYSVERVYWVTSKIYRLATFFHFLFFTYFF